MAEKVNQNAVKQTAIQPPPMLGTPAELNATKNIETIVSGMKYISVGVIISSVICFICGIVQLSVGFTIYAEPIWGSVLPFVAGILGVSTKSNARSNILNGFLIGTSLLGAGTCIAVVVILPLYVRFQEPFLLSISGFFGFGIFIIIVAGSLLTLLIYLAVYGFRLAGCCGKTAVKQQVVYVQSTNVPQGNFAQHPYNLPGVQMVPVGNVNGAYQPSAYQTAVPIVLPPQHR